jgi:hypothetical protein
MNPFLAFENLPLLANNNPDDPQLDPKSLADKVERASGPQVEKELFEARVVMISAAVDPKLAHAVNS